MTGTAELVDLPAVDVEVIYGRRDAAAPHLHSDKPVTAQIEPDLHRIQVRDARPIADSLSLDREGFILRQHEAVTPFEPEFIPFNLDRKRDLPPINRRYAEELLPLIAELSGGDLIVPQAGRVCLRATPRTGLPTSDSTAPLVHLDYTPNAVRDAMALSFGLEGRGVPAYRRVALYQTWRALVPPPHDSLLAICDARSVSESATMVMQTYTASREAEAEQIEVRLCTWEPDHRWYYFSDMQPDELLIFKGYDSDDPQSASGAHVAFDNPLTDEPNGRVSVEARFIIFYF
jgi:hypothetical protein